MTKVPLAESHRWLIVMESLLVIRKGRRKKKTARGRERWGENTQGTLRMSMDGMTMEDKCERLEPCGVMND